ncbi:MAG: hypothetical protein A2Z42_00630 [Candidatus Woykebacteria bacterium RBG_19FT_COMBO_43_10]|uniref:Uncharacterized protein n=1 Tax=Candidatus Woykebacteria bacterium RBG_19FT_COMBO_43_10 TaxID=1802598 RepID=A0A1G1WL48_9BACT|nr:MAG: hypothetical protein A2Z42_00630 [Candidatus Woykebacteria bacterium RBG_19FT_COMBO_43_10]
MLRERNEMALFKNNEKTALISLLVLAFVFYFTSFYLLRTEQGIAFKKIDFQILGMYFLASLVAAAFLFFYLWLCLAFCPFIFTEFI